MHALPGHVVTIGGAGRGGGGPQRRRADPVAALQRELNVVAVVAQRPAAVNLGIGNRPLAHWRPSGGASCERVGLVAAASGLGAVALFGHPARQLATTCTWAVDPQDVDANTWRPALVSRT